MSRGVVSHNNKKTTVSPHPISCIVNPDTTQDTGAMHR
jgi:hypothetical protein